MIEGAFITPHAIDQFLARVDRSLTRDEARAAIVAGLQHGGPARPLRSGAGIVIRVRRRPYSFRAVLGPGEGRLPAVITILRSGT